MHYQLVRRVDGGGVDTLEPKFTMLSFGPCALLSSTPSLATPTKTLPNQSMEVPPNPTRCYGIGPWILAQRIGRLRFVHDEADVAGSGSR